VGRGEAVPYIVIAGLLEEQVQRLALGFIEADQHLVLGRGECALRLGQAL